LIQPHYLFYYLQMFTLECKKSVFSQTQCLWESQFSLISNIKSCGFCVFFHKYISACVFEINSIRLNAQNKNCVCSNFYDIYECIDKMLIKSIMPQYFSNRVCHYTWMDSLIKTLVVRIDIIFDHCEFYIFKHFY